jgi:putative thioredoxin
MAESPHVFEADEQNFQAQVIERSHTQPVLVDFWADWCAPCRTLMPVLNSIVTAYDGAVVLAKVDTEKCQSLAAQFDVRSLPTVKLFRHGIVVDEFMGAQPESAIHSFLEPYLERASDALCWEAEQLAATGDIDGAVTLLEQARSDDPENPRVTVPLTEHYLALHCADEAQQVLAAAPRRLRNSDALDPLKAKVRLALQTSGEDDEQSLRAAVESSPRDCAARLKLGARLAADGHHEQALDELLAAVQVDRTFQDGAARKAMVDIFQSLGNSGPVVSRYRSLLSRSLH